MRKYLYIFLALLFASPVYADFDVFSAKDYTGGCESCADSINGSLVNDGDVLIVWESDRVSYYQLDEDSGVAEGTTSAVDPVDPIAPDLNAGDKRWVLMNFNAGVTNGDSHNHVGGDGGPLPDAALSSGSTVVSAGAADSGKFVKLDGDGDVDASAINSADVDHDQTTNYAANEHFTEASIDHTAISNIGTNTHAQLDTFRTNLDALTGLVIGASGTYNDIARIKCVSQYSNNLATAVSSIGNVSTLLIVDANITISSNLDIATDAPRITLLILKGAVITVNTGVTLTISRMSVLGVDAWQKFICSGTGQVIFSSVAVKYVLPEWFGAARDGSTDDQPEVELAIEAAQNVKTVLFLTGVYALADTVDINYSHMVLRGISREGTKLFWTSDPSGNGGIDTAGYGTKFIDLTFENDEADTNARGSLLFSKPAIYAPATAELGFYRLKFIHVYDGIDLTGNSGGTYMDDIEMMALNVGIDIDGSLDSIRINNFHYWPYDTVESDECTGNGTPYSCCSGAGTGTCLGDIFADSTNIGIQIGRADGLVISNGLFINQKGLYFTGTDGGWTSVVNTDFDHRSKISVNNNVSVQISNSQFTKGESGTGASIAASDGNIQIDNCFFYAVDAQDSALIYVSTSGSAYHHYSITNSRFDLNGADVSAIDIRETSSDILTAIITGNNLFRDANSGSTTDTVNIAGYVRVIFSNNIGSDPDTDSGNYKFFVMDTNTESTITGNHGLGQAIDIPATRTNIFDAANSPTPG